MLPCFFHDVFSRFSSQNRFSRFQLFFPTFGPGIRTRPCQKPSTHSPARFHRRYLLGHVLWGELFCAASVLWKMVISGKIMGISMEYPHQYTHYIPGLVDFKPQKTLFLVVVLWMDKPFCTSRWHIGIPMGLLPSTNSCRILPPSTDQTKKVTKLVKQTAGDLRHTLVGGIPTPLKNGGVRQLGLWNSQYIESHKIPWFQTTK